MGCQYIYKDANGNESAIYARALEKYGPDRAEEIYIHHMMSSLDARFSVESMKDLESRGDLIESTPDKEGEESVYIEKGTGRRFTRVGTELDNWTKPKSTPLDALKGGTSLERAKSKQALEYLIDIIPAEHKVSAVAQNAYIIERLEKHPDIQARAEKDVQTRWTANRNWGKTFHAVADEVLKTFSTYRKEDADGKVIPINVDQETNSVIEATFENLADDKKYREGTNTFNFSKNDLTRIFKPIFDSIQKKEKLYKESFKIRSEQKIYTDKLKSKESPASGIAGTLDAICLSKSNRYNMSIDFKTTDSSHIMNFDNTNGTTIEGPFRGIENTKEAKAVAQQLLYGAILRQENGINLTDTLTVVVPLNFAEEGKNEIGDKVFTVAGIGTKPIILENNNVSSKIGNIVKYYNVASFPKYYEDARKIGPSGVVEKWSGSKDGEPNASFAKRNKDAYIKKKLTQISTTTEGNQVIYFLNNKVDVSKMTPEEITKTLEIEWTKAKEAQEHTGKDIVEWFNSKDEYLPRSLSSKSKSIGPLLHNIDRNTHTLELAEEAYPELAGIGPDVIIATNDITKTVSLLSAIAVMNQTVDSFPTDGSKDTRTSFLGNYVPDKVILTGELGDKLLHSPKTHDYIAMKLGIAALYLNDKFKASGRDLNVDVMRVGTVMLGDRIYTTDTTPEEEFSKLQLFAKYAGDDFPEEYKKLLKQVEGGNYEMSIAKNLDDLMAQIDRGIDPLGKVYAKGLKDQLVETYARYKDGQLVGTELKKLLGNYVEKVAMRLASTKTTEQIRLDPRYIAASKAYLEYLKFDNTLTNLAKERIALPFIKSATTSGDPIMLRLQVQYNEASAVIRKQMEKHMDEHNVLLKALMASKGVTTFGNADAIYSNMYKDTKGHPENRLMLKVPGTPEFNALTKAEQDYIVFFNKSIKKSLMSMATDTKRVDIENDRFWKPGSVPAIFGRPELLDAENFTSWKNLKNAVAKKFQSLKKSTAGTRSLLEFDYKTQFDAQATDDAIGNSDQRRRTLGLKDLNAPEPEMPLNVETNLALIANLAALEASEKENYHALLQTVAASQSLLATEGDRGKMTSEMVETWKNMVIFNRYNEETNPELTGPLDAINKTSSAFLFTLSIKQAMIEATRGTLRNASSLISNSIQNAVASFVGQPENGGRFTPSEWLWATNAWNKYDPKLEQMVRDSGMLCADADDMKTPEFRGKNKAHALKSKAGFWLNRLFFDTAIQHTFLSQAKHLGITDAYTKQGTRWLYDETKDPRFFAYDKERGIGKEAPKTEDELKRHALWKAVRETLDAEGMLSPDEVDDKGKIITPGKRMLTPLTANERAEMKNYATRLYGSFNKDTIVNGEAYAVGRAMFRYKKWFTQVVANYYTPTIHGDAIYGHWENIKNEDTGEYNAHWQGDDFEGILQTVNFIRKELMRTKKFAFTKSLNRYQRENVANLTADAALISMMFAIVLPFLSDKDEEVDPVTGKIKTTVGTFGKSMVGVSAYNSVVNAAGHMTVVVGASHMASNIFPSLSLTATAFNRCWKGGMELIHPTGTKAHYLMDVARTAGLGKSISAAHEIMSGTLAY